jgi:hypothetical protein
MAFAEIWNIRQRMHVLDLCNGWTAHDDQAQFKLFLYIVITCTNKGITEDHRKKRNSLCMLGHIRVMSDQRREASTHGIIH